MFKVIVKSFDNTVLCESSELSEDEAQTLSDVYINYKENMTAYLSIIDKSGSTKIFNGPMLGKIFIKVIDLEEIK